MKIERCLFNGYFLFISNRDVSFQKSTTIKKNVQKKLLLSTFATETAGELEVTSHEGDALGVEGAEVGVGEETGDVSFSGFLESGDGGGSPAETVLVAGGELTDEALEGSLAHQKIGGLLVLLDLAEGDGAGSPAELLGAGGLGGLSLSLAGLLGGLGDGGGLCAGHFV